MDYRRSKRYHYFLFVDLISSNPAELLLALRVYLYSLLNDLFISFHQATTGALTSRVQSAWWHGLQSPETEEPAGKSPGAGGSGAWPVTCDRTNTAESEFRTRTQVSTRQGDMLALGPNVGPWNRRAGVQPGREVQAPSRFGRQRQRLSQKTTPPPWGWLEPVSLGQSQLCPAWSCKGAETASL